MFEVIRIRKSHQRVFAVGFRNVPGYEVRFELCRDDGASPTWRYGGPEEIAALRKWCTEQYGPNSGKRSQKWTMTQSVLPHESWTKVTSFFFRIPEYEVGFKLRWHNTPLGDLFE